MGEAPGTSCHAVFNPESAVHLSADGADGADRQSELPGYDPGPKFTPQVHGTARPSS